MDKIKQWLASDRGKDILTIIIVVLVGLASFGLGRLSKGGQNEGIKIEYLEQSSAPNASASSILGLGGPLEAKAAPSKQASSGTYFASSRGSKYYTPGCSGGKTIKQENRIYFSSESEAISAGYEKSTSCK